MLGRAPALCLRCVLGILQLVGVKVRPGIPDRPRFVMGDDAAVEAVVAIRRKSFRCVRPEPASPNRLCGLGYSREFSRACCA